MNITQFISVLVATENFNEIKIFQKMFAETLLLKFEIMV